MYFAQHVTIKELKTHVDAVNAPNSDWDAIDKQWREGVGIAQKKLPVHIVYEYCSDEPFFPKPAFTTQPTLKKQFYNWITNLDENWFLSDSKLGTDFAIYKGRWRATGCAQPGGLRTTVRLDLVAITRLCEVRTKDFNDLEEQLGVRPDDNPDLALQKN